MPKLTKKFLVFPDSDEIYVATEWDYKIVKEGIASVYDTLGEAKKEAIANLERMYKERLEQINNLKYKDIK